MNYQWTAWDQSKWDHYHHAGIQVRFYRVCPFRIVSHKKSWLDWIVNLFVRKP